jgi:hypothetical protein
MSGAQEWWPAPPPADATELTVAAINYALVPVSIAHGYCLCLHPMMSMINFAGRSCQWCGQPVTDQAYEPAAKQIRTEAVKAAYPQFVKQP